MRVLVVTCSFPSHFEGVPGVFILKQVQALRALGHDVSVLRILPFAPPFGSKWEKYRALGNGYSYEGVDVAVERTLILPGLRNFEHLRAQTAGLMRRAFERFRPHVVHAHYLQYPGSISVARGKPTVITSHGIDGYDWPWRREGLRRDAIRTMQAADVVVGVSGFIAGSLQRLVDRRVEVVFNGGDAGVFGSPDRRLARQALQIPDDRDVLAFAGTLGVDKGIFDLVEALRRLRHPPLLLAMGYGRDAQAFDAALREASIEARLFGGVSQSMVATAFAAADAVTLPSHKEGLPVTICEAMLSSRPVIATTVGGIPEIITSGETGLLAAPGDIAELSRLYADVFADRQRAAAIAQRAAAFARRNLTWEANARAYDRLYATLAGRRAA